MKWSVGAVVALGTWASTLTAAVATAPTAAEVYEAFRRIAAAPLWPGFEPGKTPVAIFDGKATWLFGHPQPPGEFADPRAGAGAGARAGAAGRLFPGQHAAVRANSSAEIGGVTVATVLLAIDERRSADEMASVAIHETFHVYHNREHPGWTADEGALMTYPTGDPILLMMRRCESEALRRALLAGGPETSGWIAEAMSWRGKRFDRLGEAERAVERGMELREGLAQYVERKSLDRLNDTSLPPDEFPPEALRKRCYDVGQALAVLLDRLQPGWQEAFHASPSPVLDMVLQDAVARSGTGPRALPPDVVLEITRRAARDAAAHLTMLALERDEFLARPGWTLRVIVEPGAEPLWPQAFDPMNLTRLGDGALLHTRWLRLGNRSGSLEVLNRSALTLPAGAHPLFNGVGEVVVTGLHAEPSKNGDKEAHFDAEGISLRLDRATIERDGNRLTIRLMPP